MLACAKHRVVDGALACHSIGSNNPLSGGAGRAAGGRTRAHGNIPNQTSCASMLPASLCTVRCIQLASTSHTAHCSQHGRSQYQQALGTPLLSWRLDGAPRRALGPPTGCCHQEPFLTRLAAEYRLVSLHIKCVGGCGSAPCSGCQSARDQCSGPSPDASLCKVAPTAAATQQATN